MPDASSATSKMCWLCSPAIASGWSGRLVRAVTKHSLSSLSVIWSVVKSQSARHASGNLPNHFSSSGHSASNNCGKDGAVTAHLNGTRVLTNQVMVHAARAVLPTPWPDLMEMRVWPCANARSTSICQASGCTPSTSRTNPIGARAYRLMVTANGFSAWAIACAQSVGIISVSSSIHLRLLPAACHLRAAGIQDLVDHLHPQCALGLHEPEHADDEHGIERDQRQKRTGQAGNQPLAEASYRAGDAVTSSRWFAHLRATDPTTMTRPRRWPRLSVPAQQLVPQLP